ncbi:hypothetical protein [Bacillus sp. 03113]|uniref:hypothetical protein n=1 Tax=Bacillus sp. 03113 TaxID=2578211 RepID=UPI00215B79AC|nr:hypothetical protein [Bacillus sp. 03113]
MAETSFRLKKIWTDIDFFEVNLKLIAKNGSVSIDFYLDNHLLEELRQGLVTFVNQFGKNEFTWITGDVKENETHYLSMRFFLHDKRGVVGIEVHVDNKLELPDHIHSHFYLLTEFSQLDDLARKLEKLIKEEVTDIESLNIAE